MKTSLCLLAGLLLPPDPNPDRATLGGDPGVTVQQSPAQDPSPDRATVRGDHFEVTCHWRSERNGDALARQVLDAAEATWAAAAELHGRPLAPLEERCRIQVHLGRKELSEAVPDVPKGVFWSTDEAGRETHVAMRPKLSDLALTETGMPAMTLRRAAIEAARLAIRHARERPDGLPEWYVEGAAQELAHRGLVRVGRSSPWLDEPATSELTRRVVAARDAGRLPTVEALVGDGAGELDEDELAGARALLFRFLLESSRLEEELVDASGIGPGEREALQASFDAWLAGLEPRWEETVPSLSRCAEGWVQTSVGRETNALCFTTRPVGRKEYTIRGEFLLISASREVRPQLNVVLGRLDEDYLLVALSPGRVTVFSYTVEKGFFEEITSKNAEDLYRGVSTEFEIRVGEEEVWVTVAGTKLAPFSVIGRDMTGAWGLGALFACSGIWKDVRVE